MQWSANYYSDGNSRAIHARTGHKFDDEVEE